MIRRSFIFYLLSGLCLFSCGSATNNVSETNSDIDTAALVEPSKQDLTAFADTLYGRNIVNKDTLDLIYSAIEKGEIKNGAFDFLPYCKNSTVIHIDDAKRNQYPEEYMQAVYAEIASIIPGFEYKNSLLEYDFKTESDLQSSQDEMAVEAELDEASPLPEGSEGHNWTMEVFGYSDFSYYDENFYDYFVYNEWELVDLINILLDNQKSDYRVVLVHLYEPDGDISATPEFGVIALPKKQGEYLYFSEEDACGEHIIPWFYLSTWYTEYLSADSVKKTIDECKKIGLFDHLNKAEIDTATKKALAEPFEGPYEFICLFPGIGNLIEADQPYINSSYTKTLQYFSEISNGKFNPFNIRETPRDTAGYFGDEIILSFQMGGKYFWTRLSKDFNFNFDFIDLANRALTQCGRKGQFYFVHDGGPYDLNYPPNEIIYLSDKQAEIIREKDILSIHEPVPYNPRY